MKKILIVVIAVSFIILGRAHAWDDKETHPALTEKAVKNSVLNKGYIKNTLHLPQGVDTELTQNIDPELDDYLKSKTIMDWLRFGAEKEDIPWCRASNHFHNPDNALGWPDAGLTDTLLVINGFCKLTSPYPAAEIVSNLTWATGYINLAGGTNQYVIDKNKRDWNSAREYFYIYLTGKKFDGTVAASNEDDRKGYLALSFEALGQVAHLLEDMAVPAHVRDDYSQGHWDMVPFQGKWFGNLFEIYVKLHPETPWFDQCDRGNLSDPSLPKFWDTNLYNGANPAIDKSTIGLAEYTNRNFVSEYTIFTNDYPYPSESDTNIDTYLNGDVLPETVLAKDGVPDNLVHIKTTGSNGGEVIDHFLKPSYLTNDPKITSNRYHDKREFQRTFKLDEACFKDYAAKLVPRAIGYAADVIDYFFRGDIQISCLPVFYDNILSALQVKVKNMAANDAIGAGSFYLLCRYNDGTDKTVSPVLWEYVDAGRTGISSGDEAYINFYFDLAGSNLITFDYMNSPQAYIDCTLVFKGTLGNEVDTAVVAKEFTLTNTLPAGTYLADAIKINEEWDNDLTGNYAWDHTAADDPANPDNGTTVNSVGTDYADGLYKENNRDGAYSSPRFNLSQLDLLTDPVLITPDTWLEFKIDEMSLTGTTDFEHQAMVLYFSDGVDTYVLQFSQPGQAMYYNDNTATWSFTLGASFWLNIYQLFDGYSIPIPDPFYLNDIEFYQQIWEDDEAPGVDYVQRMEIDHVRVVDELIAVPGVIEMTQAEAAILFDNCDLQVGAVTAVSSSLPAGQIISQTPGSGICVPYGTSVDLEVAGP